MRSLLIIWILFLLASCAKSPSEKTDEAIDVALSYLSDSKCDAAIDVLEDAGRDTSNPIYLQVLASAYACRAGYNEITFLDSQIPTIQGSFTTFMKSLSLLTLSAETEADSDDYKDFRTGINVVLNIDSGQPSQAAREAKFGPRKAGDMGLQAIFLSLNQLGKFAHFYGNVDAAGVKGGGANTNTCFIAYTSAQALAFIGTGSTGSCTPGTLIGHPDLDLSDLPTTKRRMCEGLMLVTNIIDILTNITLPDDPSMGSLDAVTTTLNNFKGNITTVAPDLEELLMTTSQAECESIVSTATDFDKLQLIYAMLFEAGLP